MLFVKSRRAQSKEDYETWLESEVSNTLNTFDIGDVRATTLIVFSPRYDEVVRIHNSDVAPTVATYYGTGGNNMPFIATDLVRRVTPIECERLQGFPDDWTKSQSDTHRYKQMGNAVTVNVIEWIGSRL